MSRHLILAPSLLIIAAHLGAVDQGQTPPSTLDSSVNQASQVLRSITWGAYGEAHYNNFQNTGKDDQLDLHRLVLMLESRLADRWRLVGEIEIEHAYVKGGTKGATDPYANGYVAVEQGYLGWQMHPRHELKVGMMLVPVSITNLHHEPTVFHGVERPLFDSRIVPSTWHEVGVGVDGHIVNGLTYAVAVQGGLAGTSFSAGNGFRDGRQKSAESSAEDLMITARLDCKPTDGLWLAVAANVGGVDQRNEQEPGASGVVGSLLVAEGRWNGGGFETGISAAHGRINDPAELKVGLPATFWGVNGFAAYDILHPMALDTPDRLFVFAMAERLVNNATMPEGVDVAARNNSRSYKVGLTYRPNTWVTFKGDYHYLRNDDGSRADSWNLGAGFAF